MVGSNKGRVSLVHPGWKEKVRSSTHPLSDELSSCIGRTVLGILVGKEVVW